MAKAGFWCMRSALCALNVVYMMVGVFLVGVAVWRRGFALGTSGPLTGAVLALALLLLLISTMGIVGTLRHHQILLFFYVLVLLTVLVVQFGVSCSCLAFSREQQVSALSSSWGRMSSDSRRALEERWDCCGLFNSTERIQEFRTDASLCTAACPGKGICFTCGDLLLQDGAEALRILGAVGLFFSFSQVLAVWLVLRYRNQKEP